jgi:YVTN family beta-propeller protein
MLASVSRDARRMCRFAALIAFLGCTSGPSDPGQLALSVTTFGADQDSDGYLYSLDGNPAEVLEPNDEVTISGLNAGIYQLTIDGVASNCTLSGDSPRSVAVSSGETRVIDLEVECTAIAGLATLQITTVTTGDVDPDGYTYTLDNGVPATIGSNSTVTLTGQIPGAHQLGLGGVASNCTISGGTTRSITLSSGLTTTHQINVSCTESFPAVLETVSLSGVPYGVAVSPSGVIYAALIGSTTLARGDLATRAFTSDVTVGSTPPHVVFNPAGTIAYATLQTGQGLAVVDAGTNALVATVPLSSDGFNLIVAPDGQRVYVTTANGTLYVIDASDNSVVTTLAVGAAANGLAFSPDASVLYVSSRDAGTVVAVDPSTNAVTRTYTIGGMPQRLAVSPDGLELYVANETSGLNVVDVASGAVSSTSFGTAAYGLGLTPDGAHLYVLLPAVGQLRVLDRATRSAVKTLFVGGTPRNVVFAADGTTALIANEQAIVFVGDPATP